MIASLTSQLRFAALVTGAIVCAISLWVIEGNFFWALAALVLGGIGGFCISLVIGPLIFRTSGDQVVVVKLGPGALAEILRANLTGAGVSGMLAAVVPAVLFADSVNLGQFVGLGVGVGIVVSAALGYVASR